MTLRTLNYGNYGIFLIMGNAGFCPSTVSRVISALSGILIRVMVLVSLQNNYLLSPPTLEVGPGGLVGIIRMVCWGLCGWLSKLGSFFGSLI